MKAKAIFGLFAFGVVALFAVALSSQPVQADDHKVTICHATNSQTNPYTTNTVSKSSVDEPNNKYLNGHGDHTGPVWYSGIANHSWGDIIPPFTYEKQNGDVISFPGYNWTTEGQAFYDNSCAKPGMEPEFEYEITEECGSLDIQLTKYPIYPGKPYVAVYTTNGIVEFPVKTFPAQFEEDENGGSVSVTWFIVGPEKDHLVGSGYPNYWDKIGETIVVDTDCEEEEVKESDITASVKCATVNEQMMIELTLANSGEADGAVMVNGEEVEVEAGDSVILHFEPNTQVVVVDGEETILDETLECKPGQGGYTPETPKTETPETPQVAMLPHTAGGQAQILFGAMTLAGLVLVAGTAIKSRLLA